MRPSMPVPTTFSRSQTELAGMGRAGRGTFSMPGTGVAQPERSTLPAVGSAVTLKEALPSLRTNTGFAPAWP
jgi:hypothetical protein